MRRAAVWIGLRLLSAAPALARKVTVDDDRQFDPGSDSLPWRGTASDTLKSTAENNAQLINKAVRKAFEDFPPREKR